VAAADESAADDAVGEHFRRRGLAIFSPNAAGEDLDGRQRGEVLEGLSAGNHLGLEVLFQDILLRERGTIKLRVTCRHFS
jgi:hypothetical protein